MTKIQGRNTPRSHCERNTRMQEQNFPNVGSRYVVYSLLFPLQCRGIPSYSPNTTKRRWSEVQVTSLRQTERDSVSEVEMDCKNLGCRKGVGSCGWLWHLGWNGAGLTEQNWSLWLTTVIIGSQRDINAEKSEHLKELYGVIAKLEKYGLEPTTPSSPGIVRKSELTIEADEARFRAMEADLTAARTRLVLAGWVPGESRVEV